MYLSTVAEIEINIDFLQHFGLLQLAWAAWAAKFAQQAQRT